MYWEKHTLRALYIQNLCGTKGLPAISNLQSTLLLNGDDTLHADR